MGQLMVPETVWRQMLELRARSSEGLVYLIVDKKGQNDIVIGRLKGSLEEHGAVVSSHPGVAEALERYIREHPDKAIIPVHSHPRNLTGFQQGPSSGDIESFKEIAKTGITRFGLVTGEIVRFYDMTPSGTLSEHKPVVKVVSSDMAETLRKTQAEEFQKINRYLQEIQGRRIPIRPPVAAPLEHKPAVKVVAPQVEVPRKIEEFQRPLEVAEAPRKIQLGEVVQGLPPLVKKEGLLERLKKRFRRKK
jgi:hypothetical protein